MASVEFGHMGEWGLSGAVADGPDIFLICPAIAVDKDAFGCIADVCGIEIKA